LGASAPEPRGPAFGLTEQNADLLWAPGSAPKGLDALAGARAELTALHPTYLRLLIDWARLQPSPQSPPRLEATISGCARGLRPCGAYAGVREELAAIASEQHAQRGSFHVVIDVLGAPSWAALAPSGCELGGTTAFARPLRPQALASYRALIGSLLHLGQEEGVTLEWWSPWNEPNDPRFISPQRAECSVSSPTLSPAVYAQLARAMAAELQTAGGAHHLILGELNDLEVDSPHTTSVSEFVGALPADVLCLGAVWSIHAYARYGGGGQPLNGVGTLEQALDARGGCAAAAPIWVTEAGAGAPHPGLSTAGDSTTEAHEGCLALQRQLLGWYGDSRVKAVFQYTFREDPAFPVGLASADLSQLLPPYGLWLAWSRLRASDEPPPTAAACA
jgi:hypothetical protein